MTGCRFPRTARLLTAGGFKRVFSRSRRSADTFFTVLAAPQGESASMCLPRLGLAISKKQVRKAVDRNRIKRLARETFRRQLETLPLVDMVVMARRAAVDADSDSLRKSLDRHFSRLAKQIPASDKPKDQAGR